MAQIKSDQILKLMPPGKLDTDQMTRKQALDLINKAVETNFLQGGIHCVITGNACLRWKPYHWTATTVKKELDLIVQDLKNIQIVLTAKEPVPKKGESNVTDI